MTPMNLTGLEPLYTAAETRDLDSCAITRHGIPGATLMSRAAHAAFDALLSVWPEPEYIQVLCGTGNNGGDGYLLADIAHKRGIGVVVYQLGDPTRIIADAALARQQALASGVAVVGWKPGVLEARGVVVDAMLGSGLGGDVREPFLGAIDELNQLDLPVLAVDIPSGLCADSGRVLGRAVRADLTVSFIGLKRGLFCLQGPDHAGERLFAGLGVPDAVYTEIPAGCRLLDLDTLLEQVPTRAASAHKGDYGSVLVIGGDLGMGGAGAMAAEAALRCCAGLVRLAPRPQHVAAAIARCPEVMARGIDDGLELLPMIDASTVLVIGPGLGQSDWSAQVLRMGAESGKPLVLDADGLNLLAHGRELTTTARDNWILTPHPGEAARLLGCSTEEVQQDRFAAVQALQQRYGGIVLLKGNGSLVADGEGIFLCDYGNPGMASGGMGDVLSGTIGALLAQGLCGRDATVLGVCLHAAAADLAAEDGQRGLAATDLLPVMRELLG